MLLGGLLLLLAGGCGPYFNTFFNARKSFNAAEKLRKQSPGGRAGRNEYNVAIEKARDVVDNYPNSKYYDDALYILGVSYYHTEQYGRAERRFREILANYADSKFAKESRLYLAQSKLQLNEISDAMELFEEIFTSNYSRQFKSDAAMALGKYRHEEGDYERSRSYFMAVRDSLGSDEQRRMAQMYIADGYYEKYQFSDALGAYLQVLGMSPTVPQEYHALFRSADCSYQLLRIDDGIAYLNRLMENQLYYDSLSVLKMKVAEGYEYQDDLRLAENIYREVAEEGETPLNRSEAYYRLALIYQFDYDDLFQAKDYYDQAAKLGGNTDWGHDALQRSSDIGKLESFTRAQLDTSATQDDIDKAAFTQYKLSELYWFKLNKPDTAILEMQYVVDSFPKAYYAPKAMIALSGMYRSYREDTLAADSILKLVLRRYPHSDFVPEALDNLGLKGSAVDTGYAELYFHEAEDFLIDEENYDSARFYFQYVVDSFPDSKLNLQARFNLIYLDELYNLPGDSSLVYAYVELIDSFPGTPQAERAKERLSATRSRSRSSTTDQPQQQQQASDTLNGLAKDGGTADSGYVDPLVSLYVGPDGDTLTALEAKPVEIEQEFEFPTEAYNMQEMAFYLYFQILVDFSGEVVDYVLKIPSQYEEVNRRASETVASMRFDPLRISELVSRWDLKQSEDGRGYWLVYKFLVEKPEFLR
jgi:TolA-binding protein